MPASIIIASFRIGTWCCIVALAVLSLLPADEMIRTGFPGGAEHFVAYAGSAAIAMAGYGRRRGSIQIIGGFWVYVAVLEYLQHFRRAGIRRSRISPSRQPGHYTAAWPSACFGGAFLRRIAGGPRPSAAQDFMISNLRPPG